MSFLTILQDGFFAAVAGIGFGSISNPRPRLLWLCGAIAAIGHAVRFVLLGCGLQAVTSNFLAGLAIGILSEFGAFWKKTPSETLAFPALLPMIPGMYAYGTFQALFKILASPGAPDHYCGALLYNLLTALAIILMLVSGAFLPKMLRGR